jgi:leucyl/phenylalanyl-tRNA--protein transferase
VIERGSGSGILAGFEILLCLTGVIPIPQLLEAYAAGFFPMSDGGRIRWYSPNPRGILPLDRFHAPRRLARVVRGGRFEIRVDTAFRAVIEACAADRVEGSWISPEIVESYCALHHAGIAHSVEAWREGTLAGGLYGVALGGAFFGESMFHKVTDASKVALAALVARLRERHFALLDIQWVTPHLETFGAIEIPRRRYLMLLEEAIQLPVTFL